MHLGIKGFWPFSLFVKRTRQIGVIAVETCLWIQITQKCYQKPEQSVHEDVMVDVKEITYIHIYMMIIIITAFMVLNRRIAGVGIIFLLNYNSVNVL